MQELDSLAQFGYLRDDIFETIRGQLFPTGTTEIMENRDFTAYVYRAVKGFALNENKAKQILELAVGDENFEQHSPEEVFFGRERFNSEGLVYDDNIDEEYYEWLGSMPLTVGAYESVESQEQQQQHFGWWSSYVWSKIVQTFRLGRGECVSQTI